MRPDAAVDPLGVEVRVGQKGLDPSAADGLLQRPIERHQVRARPATGHGSEDHVAGAIDHEDDLREFGVSRDLVAVPAARAALDVGPAGVPRFPASAVDSGQRDTSLADPSRTARSSTESNNLRAGAARSSLRAAFWKVVKWGTVFIPI